MIPYFASYSSSTKLTDSTNQIESDARHLILSSSPEALPVMDSYPSSSLKDRPKDEKDNIFLSSMKTNSPYSSSTKLTESTSKMDSDARHLILSSSPEASLVMDSDASTKLTDSSTQMDSDARNLILSSSPEASLVMDSDASTKLTDSSTQMDSDAIPLILSSSPEASPVMDAYAIESSSSLKETPKEEKDNIFFSSMKTNSPYSSSSKLTDSTTQMNSDTRHMILSSSQEASYAIESSSSLKDRPIPSSSPEAIQSTSPVIDGMDRPSALILPSSFSAQLPEDNFFSSVHSPVKRNIKTRRCKY